MLCFFHGTRTISGTRMASKAAMSEITPQEQKGENAPAIAPSPIIRIGVPVKALATRLSAPVAPALEAWVPAETPVC